jgi:hypothetical protein
MYHSKFEAMEESLKGPSLVEYLATNFEILNQFKIVKIGLPIMSYATCIDLDILIKEMMDYDIPSDSQWKEIVWLGKTKCSFPGTVSDLRVSPSQRVRQKIRTSQMS